MKSIELKVGALLLASLLLLGGFVVVLGNFSLRGGYRIAVDYEFSGNLQPGAAVKISGIKVGKVEDVRYLGGVVSSRTGKRVQVQVTAWVESRVRDAIRHDAEFFVNTQGVLGEQYLEIRPGADYDRLPLGEDQEVEGVSPPRTDLIVARLYDVLDSISLLLKDDKDVIRDFLKSGASVVRTLDVLLKDNQQQIARLLADVDQLSREGAGLLASIRSGVGDAQSLRTTLANIESMSGTIRRELDPMLAKVNSALDGVNRLTSIVGPGERDKLMGALDELISVEHKVHQIATDAQLIVADVKHGKGTAGALIVDQQIYDDVKEMVRDLKRNPWKFFWKE